MKECYRYFMPAIEQTLSEIEASAACILLSSNAKQQIKEIAVSRLQVVANDYFLHTLAKLCEDSNPLLQFDASMITKEEIRRTVPVLLGKLERKELILPKRLEANVRIVLERYTSYMKQLVSDLSSFRNRICGTLFEGNQYTTILGLVKAGDSHNHGKFTVIVDTDAGKLVYKPHSCRVDAEAFGLMKDHFDDIIRMPKVFAFEDRFGAVQFLEKQRAQGPAQAARYYYALGGTAAVFLTLGSKDMHLENLFSCGEKIAIIDVETLLYPFADLQAYQVSQIFSKEDQKAIYNTLIHSDLANTRIRVDSTEMEFSILINTGEEGSAPVVNGVRQSVLPYEKDFYSGFSDLYDRCLKLRPVLKADIPRRFSKTVCRCILSGTNMYTGIIRRLNSCYSYSSEVYYASQYGKLGSVLTRGRPESLQPVYVWEEAAIMEADIPYFQVQADSLHLICDGQTVMENCFLQSAVDRSMEILDHMSEAEKEFELRYLRLSIAGAKVIDPGTYAFPEDAGILSKEQALTEAEWILDQISERTLTLHTGTQFWLAFDPEMDNPDVMPVGLYAGISGMAVYFAAMEKAARSPGIRQKAASGLDASLLLLERYVNDICLCEEAPKQTQFSVGEGNGIAGILRALLLTDRFREGSCIHLIRRICSCLTQMDLTAFSDTDKSSGLAGLIVTLCRFETLYHEEHILPLIRSLCDRLKKLQTLKWQDGFLWQTLPNKNHPISGAVHGMAGIAEAFYLAGKRLGTDAYEACAREALLFEDKTYSEKLGGWEDLRIPGNHILSHGNCYGASGMGIIFHRLIASGISNDMLRRNEIRACRAVHSQPLYALDHLCCGNMSVADYYLETGAHTEAGKLLASVIGRRKACGSYHVGYAGCLSNDNVTLFYGFAGIGYELLRYVDSTGFPSVL